MAKYDPVKQKDWQIAEIAEAEMIPFDTNLTSNIEQ
jgi:hypothetical protein